MYFFILPIKFSHFSQLPLFPVRKSDQASVVVGPVIAAMAYKYKRLVLTRKTL